MKFLSIFVLLFIHPPLSGQIDFEIFRFAHEANESKEIHNSINPFTEMLALKDFGLSDTVFNYLGNDTEGIVSKNGDSVNALLIIDHYGSTINQNLEAIFQHPYAPYLDYDQLLSKFNVTSSDDGKLISVSYYANMGGTYQSQETYILFKVSKDSLIFGNIKEIESLNSNSFQVFKSDGYGYLKSIRTEHQTKYLLIGGVKSCSSCYTEYLSLVSFEKGEFQLDFEVEIMNRSWDKSIFLNEKNLSLKIQYEIDDLAETCSCNGNRDGNHATEGLEIGSICTCYYKWENGNFIYVDRSIEAPKTD